MRTYTAIFIALSWLACGESRMQDPALTGQNGVMVNGPIAGTGTTYMPPAMPMTPVAQAGTGAPPPTAGTGSSEPTPVAGTGAQQPMAGTMATTPPEPTGPQLELDTCGLDTKWPGDEFCIKAPPAAEGFQMHIGPSNYDNPEREYVLQPGLEVTEDWPAVSGNDTEVYYYFRQYRMRPGSHHLIVNAGQRRLGGSSNSAKDNPTGGIIAEENRGVGMRLGARTQLSNSLHYFNFTDAPIIKEVWVNFWYRDPEEVTEPAEEIFSLLGMGIAPGQHVIKRGECEITGSGRLLTLYGHVHAHNERFSVWRKRGADRMLIHQAFDWEHPYISEFSSTVTNQPLMPGQDGGYTGIVDLQRGDVIEFECQILNDTTEIFLGLNEAENDEMCILIGDSVGTKVPFMCPSSTLPVP